MKVLWFEISTPSRYLNTGQVTLGWQDALENIVATCKDIAANKLFQFHKGTIRTKFAF